MPPKKNDWNEYKNLVLDFKRTTESKLDSHEEKLNKLLEAVAGMKIKIGLGVTAISSGVAWLVTYLSR
jgi:hypothetical protein